VGSTALWTRNSRCRGLGARHRWLRGEVLGEGAELLPDVEVGDGAAQTQGQEGE